MVDYEGDVAAFYTKGFGGAGRTDTAISFKIPRTPQHLGSIYCTAETDP